MDKIPEIVEKPRKSHSIVENAQKFFDCAMQTQRKLNAAFSSLVIARIGVKIFSNKRYRIHRYSPFYAMKLFSNLSHFFVDVIKL